MPETIKQILENSLQKLTKISETPQLDAEILLSHTLKKSRETILAHPEYKISKIQATKYKKFINRRLKNEPIAYILGKKEFYGLNFKVTRDTLIPRPETEHLVDAVISNSQLVTSKNKKVTIIDVGTGSGNIIISIAKEIKKNKLLHASCFMLYGIDFSKKALLIAKQNAKENKVVRKIKFLHSDLLNYFLKAKSYKPKANKLIIVANLPYVSGKIYSNVSPDIKKFEPKTALYSAKDGLAHYEKLLKQIKKIKNNCSMLHVLCFMEISPEQKTKIGKLIKKYLPESKVDFSKDLSGKWRIAKFEF